MTKADALARNKWVSLLLRITVVILFGGLAVQKWISGPGAFVAQLHQMFDPTGFPHWLVTVFGWAIPFIEAALAIGFIVGYKLKATWFTTGIYIIALGFGWFVLSNAPMGLITFFFLFFPIIGLYVSHADDVHA
jgi:Methylamine utilisation protein MauE